MLTTHLSNESSLTALKAELKSMDCVLEPVVSFRIFEPAAAL